MDDQQHFGGLERAQGGTGGWMAFDCCGCCSAILAAQEERGRTVTSSACMRGYEQNCRQLAHPPFKTSCVSWQINNAHKITTRSSPPGILPYRRFLVGTTRPIAYVCIRHFCTPCQSHGHQWTTSSTSEVWKGPRAGLAAGWHSIAVAAAARFWRRRRREGGPLPAVPA